MKIFKCAVTGDELFTDAKKVTVEGGFYKVEGRQTSRSNKIDDSVFGGNASAEEPNEAGAEDSDVQGIDLVLDHHYQSTGFGKKKDYQAYMKTYIKALKEKLNPADTAAFDAEILAAFKQAAEWFKDLDFYCSESMDPDGIIVLCKWETPEGKTDEVPIFYYYKCGTKEEKV